MHIKHGLGGIQIKMSLYNIPNFSNGMDDALVSVSTEVPMFPIMILVFVWMFVFMGGILRQTKRNGYADIPMWAAISSLSIFLLSLLMTISGGIITLDTLGIVIGMVLITGLWLFLTKGRSEI